MYIIHIIQCLSFSVWIITLSIIPSKSIHVAGNGKISFFFMAEWYFIVNIYHIYFVHSSVDGHLDCFHILAIVNNAAMNIGVHVSFWISVFVFLRYKPRSGIAGSYVGLFLVFWETSILFSTVAVPVYIYEGSLFSTSSPVFVICGLFDDSHSDTCEVISYGGFNLHFSDN